jgi:hypothetical protein
MFFLFTRYKGIVFFDIMNKLLIAAKSFFEALYQFCLFTSMLRSLAEFIDLSCPKKSMHFFYNFY